jgi:hypothetical protein
MQGNGGNKVVRNNIKETAKKALSGLTENGLDFDEEGNASVEARGDKGPMVSRVVIHDLCGIVATALWYLLNHFCSIFSSNDLNF